MTRHLFYIFLVISKVWGQTPRRMAATGFSMATRCWVIKAKTVISLHLSIRLNSFSVSPLQVFITNGWMSDLVVVVAVTNREAKTAAHGISLFLVENGMKGFQKGRKLEKIGLKAQVLELSGLGRQCFHQSTIPLEVAQKVDVRTPWFCRLTFFFFSLSFFQRTQLNCFLRMCGSQLAPSWGKSTRVSTTWWMNFLRWKEHEGTMLKPVSKEPCNILIGFVTEVFKLGEFKGGSKGTNLRQSGCMGGKGTGACWYFKTKLVIAVSPTNLALLPVELMEAIKVKNCAKNSSHNSVKPEHTDMIHIFVDSVWLTLYEECSLRINVHSVCSEIIEKRCSSWLQNLLENFHVFKVSSVSTKSNDSCLYVHGCTASRDCQWLIWHTFWSQTVNKRRWSCRPQLTTVTVSLQHYTFW